MDMNILENTYKRYQMKNKKYLQHRQRKRKKEHNISNKCKNEIMVWAAIWVSDGDDSRPAGSEKERMQRKSHQ
jgi:hypothetical protein